MEGEPNEIVEPRKEGVEMNDRRTVGPEEAKTAQNSLFRLEIFGILGNSIGRLYIGQYVCEIF